ncbi:MAG TPA: hypothetical protein VMC10_22490, partial [Stellaceae bacterium]|nr:hypothetical protein [Stellaceae bacterium]
MAVEERAAGTMPAVPAQSGLASALAGPLGVAVFAYALLLLVGEQLLNDPDTFWHIAAGRWIWAAH